MTMNSFITQLLRFSIVGVLNTGIDYIIFIALTWEGLLPLPAQIISYLCGSISSFLFNRRWTFQHSIPSSHARQFISFIIVNLLTLTCTSIVLEGLLHETTWSLPACKLMATLVGFIVNYTGSRFLVFGSQSGKRRN